MLVWLALAAITLIWGTTFAVVRVGLEDLAPFTGVALRFAIAGLALAAVAAWRRSFWPRGRVEWALVGANAVGTFAVPYLLLYWAEQWITSGLAAVLFSTYPLFVALAAHSWLPGERLGRRGLAGICAGFLGVLVIFSTDLAAIGGQGARRAGVVFLVSPLVAAAASVATRRWGAAVRPMTLSALPMLATSVIASVGAWLFESQRPAHFDAASVGALVYLALGGSAFTFVVYFWLLQRVEVVKLSLITYVIPVVAVAVGALWLGESVTPRVGLGAAFVLAGVAAVMARPRHRRTPDAAV